MVKISIIIRTKNEERWIGHCLSMIFKQDYSDFEVIVVDNASTDHTLEIAKRYSIAKFINIDKFFPGKALNEGIKVSHGQYIVCLSSHCIPKEINWLSSLLKNFENDPKLAGVYGRQLPVSFTDPIDKRDLVIVFGQDRRLQIKDYFFHNANSMIRKDVWNIYPFDETVKNIEDRIWGKAVTSAGYHLIYDPEASVYHYHGLHQGNQSDRAKGVVSIIERVETDVVNNLPESLKPENVNIAAVLPVSGKIKSNSVESKLFEKTINDLENSKYINNIYIVSTQKELAKNNTIWINRSNISHSNKKSLDGLLMEVLKIIENNSEHPEALIYVNYEYISRPSGLFDELIFDSQYKGYDSAFVGFIDFGHYWYRSEDNQFKQTDPSLKARTDREPIFRALYGLGCFSSTTLIRQGKMVGGEIGILPIKELKHTFRTRDIGDLKLDTDY